MTQDALVQALGLWGALISTILAAVRVYEFWRDRRQLLVRVSLTGSREIGNEIIIINMSKDPIIVENYELFWIERLLFLRRRSITTIKTRDESDWEYSIFNIAPFSQKFLHFTDECHFDWGYSTAKNRKIYLKLDIVGRTRPKWLLVYDPKK